MKGTNNEVFSDIIITALIPDEECLVLEDTAG